MPSICVVYAAAAELRINGNGCSNAYNSMIVVNNPDLNGNNSCLNSPYTNTEYPSADPDLHLDQ